MKASDAITGAIFLALAVLAFLYAGTFRPLPGVRYGPDLFPRLVAVLMGLAGIALIAGALRQAQRPPLVSLADWARRPRSYAVMGAVIGGILFYILANERLGFLATSFLMLAGLLAVTRGAARLISSALIAAVAVVLIYLVFARLLRVPLPMAVIEFMLVR